MRLQEFLYSVIRESRVFEMASDRRSFIEELTNMSQQICENLILISHSQLYGNINLQHWISELWGNIRWVVVTDLGKLNKKKFQYTSDSLLLVSRLDQYDVVKKITRSKLSKEYIELDDSTWNQYLINLNRLIEYIGKGKEYARHNFLDTIFQ